MSWKDVLNQQPTPTIRPLALCPEEIRSRFRPSHGGLEPITTAQIVSRTRGLPEFELPESPTLYAAENILNWRVERVNGRNIPTLIVLHERCGAAPSGAKGEDPFVTGVCERIRVLKLVRDVSASRPTRQARLRRWATGPTKWERLSPM